MIPVIGFGQIAFYDGVITNEEIQKLADEMSKNEAFHYVKMEGLRSISFEMDGNKGIDYEELEKIKERFVKRKARFEIHVSEYMERM